LGEAIKPRRIAAGALIVLGAVLMLAAAQTPAGAAVMILGVLIEIAGIVLEKRRR
jgi:membrane-bound ClpP family serine protease